MGSNDAFPDSGFVQPKLVQKEANTYKELRDLGSFTVLGGGTKVQKHERAATPRSKLCAQSPVGHTQA